MPINPFGSRRALAQMASLLVDKNPIEVSGKSSRHFPLTLSRAQQVEDSILELRAHIVERFADALADIRHGSNSSYGD